MAKKSNRQTHIGKDRVDKKNYNNRLFSSNFSSDTTTNNIDNSLSSNSSYGDKEGDKIQKVTKRPKEINEYFSKDNILKGALGILSIIVLGYFSWLGLSTSNNNGDIKVLKSKNERTEKNIVENKNNIEEIKDNIKDIDSKVKILKVGVEKDIENIKNNIINKK